MRVILGIHAWCLTGVNRFATNLARGLRLRGVDVSLLITEHATDLVSLPRDMMPLPNDIRYELLEVRRDDDWAAHWQANIGYLEKKAPCIYLPITDYRHSCISPKLSDDVIVVGTIQADDPVHYEHVARLGAFWNGIVCVSEACASEASRRNPSLAGRIATIPNGVPVPENFQERNRPGQPLRIIYHGVLNRYQKRILDIPRILEQLDSKGTPFELTIAGGGPQQDELAAECAPWVGRGCVRFAGLVPGDRVGNLLLEHDVYLLTSAFEGMPHAMLEAMAHGCVPVVTNASGSREVIKDGVNGLLAEIGDCRQFGEHIDRLHRDPSLRIELSRNAYRDVKGSRYSMEAMTDGYMALFNRLEKSARSGEYRRPQAKVLPPPAEVEGISIFPVEHKPFVERVEKEMPGRRTAVERVLRSFARIYSRAFVARPGAGTNAG
jgi:glycosyltransferase involved in cell wall biosynthesis